MLHLHRDSTVGRVTVRFTGQAKSKIVQSNRQSTSTFRGNSVLFGIESILHDDHYTHKNGILSWPFEFQIPKSVDSSNSREGWNAREGFLAPASASQPHPLPPSFRFAESSSSKGWHVLTTYAIEATVIEPPGSQILKTTTETSSKIIHVLPPTTMSPMDMEDPRQRCGCAETVTIRTLRLLPEHTTSLSLMQRTRSFLSPSSLPKFTFDVDVSYASSLQILHPQPLPFIVAAIPRTDAESTTIQPSMRTFYRYPTLKIRRFQLILRATTMCRCPTVFSEASASLSHDIVLADRCFSDMVLGVRSVAWDQKNRVEDDIPTSIDLGNECNVRVVNESWNGVRRSRGKTDKVAGERPQSQTLVTPSFKTYNVSRKYHLAWNIEFECAGEEVEVKGQSLEEVVVLGPAASMSGELESNDVSWMMAPEDGGDSDEDGHMVRTMSEIDVLPAYNEISGEELPVEARSSGTTAGKN